MASNIKIIQINLQHCKEATAVLCGQLNQLHSGIALIQEPYLYKGGVRGLNIKGSTLIYDRSADRPRAALLATRGMEVTPLPCLTTADAVAVEVKLKVHSGVSTFVFCSAYLPYDANCLPPTQDLVSVVEYAKNNSYPMVIGCDANSHHICWGSTNSNRRGIALLEYLLTEELLIANRGNTPTFHNAIREEVIDITICDEQSNNMISNWAVSPDASLSDHSQIHFEICGLVRNIINYRNPRKTNWAKYSELLAARAQNRIARISNPIEVEMEVNSLQEDIISSYEEACPLVVWKPGLKPHWWTAEIGRLRKKARKLWNRAKQNPAYKDVFSATKRQYKYAIRTAKRQSWQAFCSSVEGASATARVHKILSRDSVDLLMVKPPGDQEVNTTNILQYLLNSHFPGCSRSDDDLAYTHLPQEDWATAREITQTERVAWAVSCFSPFKTGGTDGIFPALLQKGIEVIKHHMSRIMAACLALGYVPKQWRVARVVFIPKPGKASYKEAKSFRPISLTSVLLKTLERLVELHLKQGILVNTPIHKHQHAYQSGLSTESALHDVVRRIERSLSRRQSALGCFLDIQGAFDSVPVWVIEEAMTRRNFPTVIKTWIVFMLQSRRATSFLNDVQITVALSRGCPQGGVLSPLLWNLVVDSLLVKLNDSGLYTQGYADDICILIEGMFIPVICELMQRAVDITKDWCLHRELSVNPRKSTVVLFTNKKNIKELISPNLNGEQIPVAKEVKYLGVILDSKLLWKRHLTIKCQKAIAVLWQCRRIVSSKWGLSPKSTRWLYTSVIRPMLTYASAIWWPRTFVGSAVAELNHVQRLACLAITGTVRTAPTSALEVMLDLLPLDIYIRKEAKLTTLRLLSEGRWKRQPDSKHSDILDVVEVKFSSMPEDRIRKIHIFQQLFSTSIPSRNDWLQKGMECVPSADVTCFTDGSLVNGKAGAGVHLVLGQEIIEQSFPLGRHTSVFQAEVFAVLQCTYLLLEMNLVGMLVNIFIDSQACIRALSSVSIRSKVVKECKEALNRLCQNNRVWLFWVPGHEGFQGNEAADCLANIGSRESPIGPQPMVGIAPNVKKSVVNDWAMRKHAELWNNVQGCRQGRELMTGPEKGRTRTLVSLPRQQVRLIAGILTGHNLLNRHLAIMKLRPDGLCEGCMEEDETSSHFLCSCPCYAGIRALYLGSTQLTVDRIKEIPVRVLVAYILATKRFS